MSKDFHSPNHKRLIDLGFRLAFKITFPSDGIVNNKRDIEFIDTAMAKRKDVTYVGILEPDGTCVKVGETGGTALGRWRGTLELFKSPTKFNGEKKKWKPNEESDQRKLREICNGRVVSVWVTEPQRINLTPIATPELSKQVRSRHATEVFVDAVFCPCFGKDISGRNVERQEK